MTNAFTNKILFGHSNEKITPEYLESMEQYMLLSNETDAQRLGRSSSASLENCPTDKWISVNKIDESQKEDANVVETTQQPTVPEITEHALTYEDLKALAVCEFSSSTTCAVNPRPPTLSDVLTPRFGVIAKPEMRPPQIHLPVKQSRVRDTLFWAIHSFIHPKDAFLRPSAANVEIETRVQIVNSMRATPKRLKDTNSKMTMEATQGLLGSMLTAREDKIEFCVAYSVFYNKHILIVYPNSCRIFSPAVETVIEDDDHVIILHAFKKQKVSYSAEPNPTKEMAENILRTKPTTLKAQSNYKMPELESVAAKFGIPTKTPESKRRKKEDVYNDVRLALHNDMNFIEILEWQKP